MKINPKDFTPWKLIQKSTRSINKANCPARDKQTKKCYGKVYFEAKFGKPEKCMKDKCKWSDKFNN